MGQGRKPRLQTWDEGLQTVYYLTRKDLGVTAGSAAKEALEGSAVAKEMHHIRSRKGNVKVKSQQQGFFMHTWVLQSCKCSKNQWQELRGEEAGGGALEGR